MYAIIQSGGKQYEVAPNREIYVDLLALDKGAAFETEDVLLVKTDDETKVGSPLVAGAKVRGKVLDHSKAKKVVIFKRKRRKGYRRKAGHRQQYTRVLIESIEA